MVNESRCGQLKISRAYARVFSNHPFINPAYGPVQAILDYCFEGNVNNDFVPQKNSRRNWYHAPWMCQTAIGREPIHGLTFERPAPSGYLADTQQRVCQSWAVAMYNEEGEALTFSYVYILSCHSQSMDIAIYTEYHDDLHCIL